MKGMKEYYESRYAIAKYIADATNNAVKKELQDASLRGILSGKNMQFLTDVVKSVESDAEYAKKQLDEYLEKEAATFNEAPDDYHE